MNGAGTRKYFGLEPQTPAYLQDVQPTGRATAKGYRQEIMNGFESERPRYNPINDNRPQSSPLVDLKDPIQVHLLTETALSDSRQWEILSQEEVDDLKKLCQSLSQRIEQTRANLAIQSKYRDAATSMSKLYSPTAAGQSGKRRSLLNGVRISGGSDAGREAEAERLACERRCEELASELFMLEKRLMDPQRRLFQHTAGILQLTHAVSSKKTNGAATAAAAGIPGGIPGSPESLYAYNADGERESMELVPGGAVGSGNGLFDERSLYFPMEQSSGGRGRSNTIEIPQKSPIRKETLVLREETDRLRDDNNRLRTECDQLRASADSLGLELAALQRDQEARQQRIFDAERTIQIVNGRLRNALVSSIPEKNSSYPMPPPAGNDLGDEGSFPLHLKYLDDVSMAVQEDQGASMAARANADQIESQLAALNGQVQRIFAASGTAVLLPLPAVSGADLNGVNAQLNWLRNALPMVQAELDRGLEASRGLSADRQAVAQVESVLTGLWDVIQSGFADLQRQQQEQKAIRAQRGLPGDDGDADADTDDLAMDLDEPYSLQAFSAKVQWLYKQTADLREHKSVLKRQIKQQRELNNKSDAEKDMSIQKATAELQRSQQAAEDAQTQLAQALLDLSEAQQEVSKKEAETAALAATSQTAQQLQLQLQQQKDQHQQELSEQQRVADAKLAELEAQSAQVQAALGKNGADMARLTAELQKATEAQATAAASAEQAAADVKSKDAELEKLNNMVVELKTEVTIARAELDGAYGSRAQRAAEVAKLAKSSENAELQTAIEKLQKELASTLKDYEDLTRDTIAAEREKLELEGQLDDAQAAKAALEAESRALRDKLETEIASLKEQLDAEKLKVAPASGGGPSRAGASMLSEQFRATMKEERKKFQEELRNEQMQRRKLEDEVRVLKRAAGPGKSPLSPR